MTNSAPRARVHRVNRKERIEAQLVATFAPVDLAIVDESHRHGGGAGAESHYNVVVVSEAFAGLGRIERHRAVHVALDAELNRGLHALTLTLRTEIEHTQSAGAALRSPGCASSNKVAS